MVSLLWQLLNGDFGYKSTTLILTSQSQLVLLITVAHISYLILFLVTKCNWTINPTSTFRPSLVELWCRIFLFHHTHYTAGPFHILPILNQHLKTTSGSNSLTVETSQKQSDSNLDWATSDSLWTRPSSNWLIDPGNLTKAPTFSMIQHQTFFKRKRGVWRQL